MHERKPLRKEGEMARWLRILVALPEDPCWVPSTHTAAHSQHPGIRCHLLTPLAPGTHVTHIYVGKTSTREIIFNEEGTGVVMHASVSATGKLRPKEHHVFKAHPV